MTVPFRIRPQTPSLREKAADLAGVLISVHTRKCSVSKRLWISRIQLNTTNFTNKRYFNLYDAKKLLISPVKNPFLTFTKQSIRCSCVHKKDENHGSSYNSHIWVTATSCSWLVTSTNQHTHNTILSGSKHYETI